MAVKSIERNMVSPETNLNAFTELLFYGAKADQLPPLDEMRYPPCSIEE